jgi:hypothetical protein
MPATSSTASRAAKNAWTGLMLSCPFSVAASSGRTRSTSENQNAMRIKKNICLPSCPAGLVSAWT